MAGWKRQVWVDDDGSLLVGTHYTASLMNAMEEGIAITQLARAATTAALPSNSRSGNVLTASANGAFPAQDGVSLSVGDLLMVWKEGTGANNGLYELTAAGGAGSKWTLTRVIAMNSSVNLATGTTVRIWQGTKYGGRDFRLTTTGTITINSTSLAFVPSVKDFGLVSSMPSSEAIVGDLATYKVDSTTFWRFIYDGEGFAWKFIGGPPMFHEITAEQTKENETWGDLGTAGPSLTVPLAGDYFFELGARAKANNANAAALMGLSIGGAEPASGDYTDLNAGAASAGFTGAMVNVFRKRKKENLSKEAALKVVYRRVGGSGAVAFQWRHLLLTPIRVN